MNKIIQIVLLVCSLSLLLFCGCNESRNNVYATAIDKIISDYPLYSNIFVAKGIDIRVESDENNDFLVVKDNSNIEYYYDKSGDCNFFIEKGNAQTIQYELDYSIWHESEDRILTMLIINVKNEGKWRFTGGYCFYENGDYSNPIADPYAISYDPLPVEDRTEADDYIADSYIKEGFSIAELEGYYEKAISYFEIISEISQSA